MATFKTFEEIEAWKKARELTKRWFSRRGPQPALRGVGSKLSV